MKKALFAGSFNPPTLGHLDIIERASKVADTLVVAAVQNAEKSPLFSLEERLQMLRDVVKPFKNVEVLSFQGLVVHWAEEHGVNMLVRGLRAYSDFDYEMRMALVNRMMTGVETVFLMADPGHIHLSSSLVCEIARHKQRLNAFVPQEIEEFVYKRLSAKLAN